MTDLRVAIDTLGGFASTRELRALGFTDHALTSAVRAGLISRVRKGLYSVRSEQDPAFRALRAGGRLTGLSALATHDAWIWRRPRCLQVAVAHNASRLNPDNTIDLHWEGARAEAGGSLICVSTRQSLVRAVLDEPLEVAVACVDWALHTGRLDRIEFEEMLLDLPVPARRIRDWVDSRSQSVLESVARVRCLQRGWDVRPQARLGDIEAIDLVVEHHVAIELDGREFHADRFDEDRLRDLRITIEGRHSIRISTSILRDHWPLVEKAVGSALAARRNGDGGFSGRNRPEPAGRQRSTRPKTGMA